MKPIVLSTKIFLKTVQKLSDFADIKQFKKRPFESDDFRSALANASGLLGAGGNMDENLLT